MAGTNSIYAPGSKAPHTLREFYRSWAEGKEQAPVPHNLQDAFLNGYNTYFERDVTLAENPFVRPKGEYYFWMYGYVRAFNEHLAPSRAFVSTTVVTG